MGKIFVIIGKSATGKDTIYKRLMEQRELSLKKVVSYTTRPIRSGETNGNEYFFVSVAEMERLLAEGKLIERRTYHTILGDWNYFTVNDGQIDLNEQDYLLITTLEGFEQMRNYYGSDTVVPIYIEAEDKVRLMRSIQREDKQASPNYAEVCRRYLADEKDFSEEELQRLEIKKRYVNHELSACISKISREIKKSKKAYAKDRAELLSD